jgi:hypothetical protein
MGSTWGQTNKDYWQLTFKGEQTYHLV